MMQYPFFRRGAWLTAAMALCLGLSAVPASAATHKDKDKAKKAATVKKQGTTKFLPGSQETRKERSERLKRECKGRVNAGVCAGYTE